MRVPIIAGNWKMNMTIQQAVELVKSIHTGLPYPANVEVVVAPPFTALNSVSDVLNNSYIEIAAQNMHWKEEGAFTGEISVKFLKELHCNYVIIGHSERRLYFGETDETINKKTILALNYGLVPIICVGETEEERKSNKFKQVIEKQISTCLYQIPDKEAANLVIAYEPVWAIGTGQVATPEQAEEIHLKIRTLLHKIFNQQIANRIRILYGGSMKPSNAKTLLSLPNVDGGLIGGAALKATDFIQIINNCI